MFRIILSRMLTAFVTLCLVGGVLVASASSSSATVEQNKESLQATAAEPQPSEEPTVLADPCGVKNDKYNIPTTNNFAYYNNADLLAPGPHITMGQHIVQIRIKDLASGEWVMPIRELQFDITTTCGPGAPNTYTLEVGSCQPASGRTLVRFGGINTDDETEQDVTFEVLATRVVDQWSYGYESTPAVPDGQSATMLLGVTGAAKNGLDPGTWRIEEFDNHDRSAARQTWYEQIAYEEGCSKQHIPPNDEMLNEVKTPTGSMKLVRRCPGKVKAVMSGEGVLPADGVSRFQFVINPAKGKTTKRVVKIPNSRTTLTSKVFKVKPKSIVKMFWLGDAGRKKLGKPLHTPQCGK